MHEPPGLVLLHQVVEDGKALVGLVKAVVQPLGRGVGQQNVDAPHPVRFEPQPPCPPLHLLFAVLELCAGVVAQTAPQPHDAQALPHIHLVVHADAAAGLPLFVAAVVVAVDIQDGGRGKVGQVLQIFLGQIAAGEDQVDPLQPFSGAVVPQRFGGDIRNRKYFHVCFAPFLWGCGLYRGSPFTFSRPLMFSRKWVFTSSSS